MPELRVHYFVATTTVATRIPPTAAAATNAPGTVDRL